MPSLLELQSAFVRGLFDAGERGARDTVVADGMDTQARLAIYRNNVFHNYQEALRDVYPVVERLVGEDFFAFAARGYVPGHPSRHGNLHRYGADFGEFLDGFEPAAGLPYLGDVARLEWLVHESFHAADHAGLSGERLAALPQDRVGELRLVLHPAYRLFRSRFPVHVIWQANQPDAGDRTLDLDDGGVFLLVRRDGYAVELEEIGAGEYALLAALREGLPLQDAFAASLAVGSVELAAFLARRVADATVVDWALAAA